MTNMTREKAKELLGKEATEERITNFLNDYHNMEKDKNDVIDNLKNQLDKVNSQVSDYDNIKKQLDDINRSKMTEQEKIDQMKKDTETNYKNSRIIYNTAKAKEILAGEDLDDELIKSLVSDNEQDTIAKANLFKQTLNNIKDNVAKKTKETLTNVDLKPSISNVNQNENVMTAEKFMDLSAEEQEKFINEHPEDFKKLQ